MKYPSASRLSECKPAVVLRTLQKARRLEAEGKTLTYLMRGEPDFTTPAHICQAAAQALEAGHTHYPPMQGIPELRVAVAERMQRDFALSVDPDAEVMITTGATMGIYAALQAFVNPGDEVILFDPCYDPYSSVVRLAGGTPVPVASVDEGGHFVVPVDRLRAAVTGRTRAILVNNPWNPTGSVMRQEELAALVDIAESNDLVLIADEIYEKLTFDGRAHHCLAAVSGTARQRTILINSFSKTYAMTGWRLGYTIAPPPLTQAMLRIAEQFSRSAATFIQYAGVTALRGRQDFVDDMLRAYTERRDLMTRAFAGLGKTQSPPEGTFFYFLDVRPYGKSSQAMADYLLAQASVVTVPGSAYGAMGEGYLRLSFAYQFDTVARGVQAIVDALGRL